MIGGVGMLIESRVLKSLNSSKRIQLRMMIATFNCNHSTKIIFYYSPTNVSKETDLIAFYNELSSLVRCIPKYIILIISGDINAQIGKNVNNEFSLHNSSNGNGEHLKDFTLENRLIYLHTNFRKERENYGSTPTQIILKHRWSTSLSIRNGMIERWIAMHIPLSRVCPSITELPRQRYDWAYEGMRPNNHNRSLRLVAA